MELSACIVVYNGADEALRAAQTVLDCTRRHPLTLYLVDNASPDGSGQRLAKAAKDGTLHIREDQKVEVLCRTENGGFGTGHNTVLSLLQSRVHFILNPDIQLTADTLSDLADWMAQHPGVVMARPALTFPDGRPQRLPLRRCSVRAIPPAALPEILGKVQRALSHGGQRPDKTHRDRVLHRQLLGGGYRSLQGRGRL